MLIFASPPRQNLAQAAEEEEGGMTIRHLANSIEQKCRIILKQIIYVWAEGDFGRKKKIPPYGNTSPIAIHVQDESEIPFIDEEHSSKGILLSVYLITRYANNIFYIYSYIYGKVCIIFSMHVLI